MSETRLVRYDAMCRAIAEAQFGEMARYVSASAAIAALELRQLHCFFFPEWPGVYVFDGAMGETLYVGESHNLRHRLTHHERGYLRRSVGVRCRILPCSNHKQVEKWLIKALQPSLNGVSEGVRRRLLSAPSKSPEQADREFGERWDALEEALA
jgi:hypothetical protein